MRGISPEFEIEVLSGCAQDSDYRQMVIDTLDDDTIWSDKSKLAVFNMIKKIDPNEPFVVETALHYINDEIIPKKGQSFGESVALTVEKVMSTVPVFSKTAFDVVKRWSKKQKHLRKLEAMALAYKEDDFDRVKQIATQLTLETDNDENFWSGGEYITNFDSRQKKRIYDREHPESSPRIATGLPSLDNAIGGGLRKTGLGIISAHSGVGKSILIGNFALQAALSGYLSILIATEMSSDLVNTRLDANLLGFPALKLEMGEFTKEEEESFNAQIALLKEKMQNNLYVFDVPPEEMNAGHIEKIIKQVERETGREVQALFVDSPDHMIPSKKSETKRLDQANIYWMIKNVTTRYNLSTWVTTQANKESIDRIITKEDLSESYDKGRIAALILTLNQNEAEKEEKYMRAFIAKNRLGPSGKIFGLFAHLEIMLIKEEESK